MLESLYSGTFLSFATVDSGISQRPLQVMPTVPHNM